MKTRNAVIGFWYTLEYSHKHADWFNTHRQNILKMQKRYADALDADFIYYDDNAALDPFFCDFNLENRQLQFYLLKFYVCKLTFDAGFDRVLYLDGDCVPNLEYNHNFFTMYPNYENTYFRPTSYAKHGQWDYCDGWMTWFLFKFMELKYLLPDCTWDLFENDINFCPNGIFSLDSQLFSHLYGKLAAIDYNHVQRKINLDLVPWISKTKTLKNDFECGVDDELIIAYTLYKHSLPQSIINHKKWNNWANEINSETGVYQQQGALKADYERWEPYQYYLKFL